jgi:hypothetical protein
MFKNSFKVFEVKQMHLGMGETVYTLKSIHREFDEPVDAVEWVQLEGHEEVDYTILEVFRKKK